MSPFEFIKYLTSDKKKWEDLSLEEMKSFSVFMNNRILSMDPEYVELVNYIQPKYNIPNEQMYKLYYNFLPTRMIYVKYIKKKESLNKELLKVLSNHFEISNREAEKYLTILSKDTLGNLLYSLGYDQKQIKKLLKDEKL